MTRKNRYPLPSITETLSHIRKARWFTKLDIIAAFNKLRMHPDSEDHTIFKPRFGAFKYLVMPFGLYNGSASWQSYMNDLFFEYLDKFCSNYLDNILIYSDTYEEHVQHVQTVLKRPEENGLSVDISQSEFYVHETKYLRYIGGENGVRIDLEKVRAIGKWPTPVNTKQMASFLRFCNFYFRSIRKYSEVARSLDALRKKDAVFIWTDDCQWVFDELKKRMVEAPLLHHYDPNLPAVLETDASDLVIAGISSQKDELGVLHPVAIWSRKMADVETRYDIHDREMLAIVACLKEWRPESERTEHLIEILSDHKGLE